MKQLVNFLVVFTSLLEIEAQQAQDINPVLKCEGCIAVVSEVNKILVRPSKQNIQSRVADSLQRLCEIDNLRTYKFSPPKMVKACNYLLQNHKQDLLSTFIENYADTTSLDFDTLLDDICWTRTKLCHGFTKKAEEKKEADILLNQDTEQVLLRQEEDIFVLETSTDENNPDSNPHDPLVEEEVDPLADEVEETISKPKEVKEKTKVKKTKIVEKQTTPQDKQGKNQKQDKHTKQKDVQKEKKVKAKELQPQENQESDIKLQENKGKQDIKSQKEKTKSNKNKNEKTNKQNQDSKIKKQKQPKQEPTQEQEASTINKEETQTQEKQSKNKNKEKPLKSKPKEQVEKNKNKQDQENLKSKSKDKLGKEQKGKKGGKTAKEEL